MYCTNCGNALRDTDLFCSKCGHKVGEQAHETPEPREEIVYNRPYTEKPKPKREEEPEEEFFFRKPEPGPDPARLEAARRSVEKAAKPVDEDFVWNVHQFPKGEARPTEDVDFQWNLDRPSQPSGRGLEADPENRFHTYNKSREEFQQLLDREYLRTNRESERASSGFIPPLPNEQPPIEDRFDPVSHVQEMEREREALQQYPAEDPWEKELYDEERRKFNTMELRRDLLQVGLDENAKTQIIEKIKYGGDDYQSTSDDFDIKKTQFVQKSRNPEPKYPNEEGYETVASDDNAYQEAISQPEMPEMPVGEEARPLKPLHPTPPTILPTGGDSDKPSVEGNVTPPQPVDGRMGQDASYAEQGTTGEIPEEHITVAPSEETPDVDQKLAKLWDTNTAPVPVASIPSQMSHAQTSSTLIPDDGDDDFYQDEEKRRGGFFGKFVIAIIIVVLILEGSILGLRHFAPESEATTKVNEVILVFQQWIETTFFD